MFSTLMDKIFYGAGHMLSQVFNVTESATTQSWQLDDMLGYPFEDFIVYLIQQILYDEGYLQTTDVQIKHTSGSNDGGKDIIIVSKVTIRNLFGFTFSINNKSSQKIFIECKSSDNGAIDYNKLSGGIQRAKDQDVDVYVVVTNTTLVPYCYYQLQEAATQNKMQFVLVDQYMLAKELAAKDLSFGKYDPITHEIKKEIKYQVLTNRDSMQQNCEVYFLIRNYSNQKLSLQISLASNWNWRCDDDRIPIALDSFESTCERIRIVRYYNDGQESLRLMLQDESGEMVIDLQGVNWDTSFLPPLCGQEHQSMIQTIRSHIIASSKFQMLFVHGEAGVGKTRVIQQLCLELKDTAINFENYSCSSRQQIATAMRNYCIKKHMLLDEQKENTLSELISQINTPFSKQVFIIDDIHNASEALYDELKKLAQQTIEQPITLILIGRDDYISERNDYFNFLSYAKEHKTQIHDYPLYPLTPEESRGLIRSILSDVPEYAMEQIFNLSNNIPLFIVQFTEYLLDLNLAHVVNRTSVSLKNHENISIRDYLPQKIENIYEKRFDYIRSLFGGDEIQEILIGLSFWGMEFPQKLAFSWGESNLLDYLFKHSFLVFSKDENIRFVHESMYLYFRHLLFTSPKWKRRVAKKIIAEKGLPWYSLNTFEQARLLLWIGETKAADQLFSTAYSHIENFKNFSSTIIDTEIDDYLYDIYECQKGKSPFPIDFAEKLFQYKAYVSLHYSSPAAAVEVCNYAEQEMETSKTFHPSEAFRYVLKELKAHSCLNMGLYQKGFNLLQELLAMNLSQPQNITQETRFDLYDRTASVYLKHNQATLALEFNSLSEKIAKTQEDPHLLALFSITKAKILFFNNFSESQAALTQASEYLSYKPDQRILCHNNVTQIISDFRSIYQPVITMEYDEFIRKSQILLDDSLQNNYVNSILRIQLFLATLFYLNKEYDNARRYVGQGIDSCIKFGYGTYLWHFYNLRAILETVTGAKRNIIQRSFETAYRILRQQNLLFLGNCDFTYENVIALTNVAKFYMNDEREYYRKLSRITAINFSQPCDYNCQKETCQYVCEDQTQLYIKERERLLKNKILFVDDNAYYNLLDPETNYFFLLA